MRTKTFDSILLLLALVFYSGYLRADTAISPESLVRHAIVDRLLNNDDGLLKSELALEPKQIIQTSRRRIGSNLHVSATKVSGQDFLFAKAGDTEGIRLHVGVWVFHYPNKDVALQRARGVRGTHFKRTKILTPFSHALVNEKLVIVFTESGGDKDVVEFIRNVLMF